MEERVAELNPSKCPKKGCGAAFVAAAVAKNSPILSRRVSKGRFYRVSDGKWIKRFTCKACKGSFSTATFSSAYRQKKRHLNLAVMELLVSTGSQRRTAKLLHLNRKTVVRKFLYKSDQGEWAQAQFLERLAEEKVDFVQFDELVTHERSKYLPLSVPLAVLPGTRKVLAFGVATKPATGLLAAKSLAKYGPREDQRAEVAGIVLSKLRPILKTGAVVLTDREPHYAEWIHSHLPESRHETIKASRGCVIGGGELKKTGFDPIFALNHTCAMFRANINRLLRRTWCTTKRTDRLYKHIMLYAHYHNTVLTPEIPAPDSGMPAFTKGESVRQSAKVSKVVN